MTEAARSPFDVEAGEDGGIRAAPAEEEDAPEPEHDAEGGDGSGERDGEDETVAGAGADATQKSEAELLAEQARRKSGAPRRRGKGRPKAPPDAGGPVPGGFRLRVPPPDEVSDDPKDWPADPYAVWEIMCGGWLQKQGRGPEAIGASVSRRVMDSRGEELKLPLLKGTDIAPYGPWSPGEMLDRQLLDVYHAMGGQGGRAGCGPARYTIAFYWMGKGGTIKTTHVELDSYFVMKEQRERADQARAHRRGAEEAGAFAPPPPFVSAGAGGSPSFGGGAGGQSAWARPAGVAQSASPAAPAASAAPAATSTVDASVYQRLGYLEAVKEEADRARLEGRAPREVADAPAGPAPGTLTAADVARIAGEALRAGLAEAGIRPKTEVDRLEEMMARNNELMLKNITALYGPPPSVGAGAAAAQPPPPSAAPAAASTVASTVEALKQLMNEFKTVKEAEGTFREMLGVEEREPSEAIEPRGPIFVEDKPKPGFFERAIDFFKGLPPGSIAQTMAAAGVMLEGSPAGQLLQKAAAAAQAAQGAKGVVDARGWAGKTPSAG